MKVGYGIDLTFNRTHGAQHKDYISLPHLQLSKVI